MASELFLGLGFISADIYSALLITLGSLMLISFIKVFRGEMFKKYAVMIGAGIFLFAVLHEGGEFICGSGIHGGFPQTLYGSIHIIVLTSIGPVLFALGAYMFQKRYIKYVRG